MKYLLNVIFSYYLKLLIIEIYFLKIFYIVYAVEFLLVILFFDNLTNVKKFLYV